MNNGVSVNIIDSLVKHPHFEEVMRDIKTAIRPPLSSQTIVVVGPPKVGKTRVRQELFRDLSKEFNIAGTTPVINLEIPSVNPKGLGSIETQIHRMMLTQLKDPYLTGNTTNDDQIPLFGNYQPLVRKHDPRHLTQLRYQTILRLGSEKCRVVLLDMRQTMTAVSQLPFIENTVRYIQNLAQDAGVPFVIFGNYDLVRNLEYLTELYETSTIIHFPRYGSSQYPVFLKALENIEKTFPGVCDFSLIQEVNAQFLYAHSLGCIGRLVDLLQNALKYNLSKGNKVITIESLEANKGLPGILTRVSEHIKIGEEMIGQSDKKWIAYYNEASGLDGVDTSAISSTNTSNNDSRVA
jgi:hypothetical protein